MSLPLRVTPTLVPPLIYRASSICAVRICWLCQHPLDCVQIGLAYKRDHSFYNEICECV